jgi:hypothetical protein
LKRDSVNKIIQFTQGSGLYRVEKTKVLMEDTLEKDLDFKLSKRSLEFFKFKDQEAVKCLSSLHDKYVIVPADKSSNNIVQLYLI